MTAGAGWVAASAPLALTGGATAAATWRAPDRISRRDLLELLAELFITGSLIGVVLDRELPVRTLDLRVTGTLRDAQNLSGSSRQDRARRPAAARAPLAYDRPGRCLVEIKLLLACRGRRHAATRRQPALPRGRRYGTVSSEVEFSALHSVNNFTLVLYPIEI